LSIDALLIRLREEGVVQRATNPKESLTTNLRKNPRFVLGSGLVDLAAPRAEGETRRTVEGLDEAKRVA
jgi:hypothetical protein